MESKEAVAIVIRAGEKEKPKEFKLGKDVKGLSCKFIQRQVGGWMELAVHCKQKEGFDIYCDEEGILKGLPFNPCASGMLAWKFYGPVVLIRRDSCLSAKVDSSYGPKELQQSKDLAAREFKEGLVLE